jgi:hypothetical protein
MPTSTTETFDLQWKCQDSIAGYGDRLLAFVFGIAAGRHDEYELKQFVDLDGASLHWRPNMRLRGFFDSWHTYLQEKANTQGHQVTIGLHRPITKEDFMQLEQRMQQFGQKFDIEYSDLSLRRVQTVTTTTSTKVF